MNESISQLLPLIDTGLAPRNIERQGQERRLVPAVVETDKSQVRNDASGTREQNAKEPEDLTEMVEKLNAKLQDMHRGLRFSVDDTSGRIVVKVIDVDTEEVIRQIPSEEMLAIIHHAADSQNLLFNDEA